MTSFITFCNCTQATYTFRRFRLRNFNTLAFDVTSTTVLVIIIIHVDAPSFGFITNSHSTWNIVYIYACIESTFTIDTYIITIIVFCCIITIITLIIITICLITTTTSSAMLIVRFWVNAFITTNYLIRRTCHNTTPFRALCAICTCVPSIIRI